jgi:hypothetical protein
MLGLLYCCFWTDSRSGLTGRVLSTYFSVAINYTIVENVAEPMSLVLNSLFRAIMLRDALFSYARLLMSGLGLVTVTYYTFCLWDPSVFRCSFFHNVLFVYFLSKHYRRYGLQTSEPNEVNALS